MRKGELLGLRKEDVNLIDGTITVRHSYAYETTNGGHADVIPVAEPLTPYLREAMDLSPSELVLPDASGKMRRGDTKLHAVLRRALGRAGIVSGIRTSVSAPGVWLQAALRRRCPPYVSRVRHEALAGRPAAAAPVP